MKSFNGLRVLCCTVGLIILNTACDKAKHVQNNTVHREDPVQETVSRTEETPSTAIVPVAQPTPKKLSAEQTSVRPRPSYKTSSDSAVTVTASQPLPVGRRPKPSKATRIKEALETEEFLTKDPALGYVPKEERTKAILQAQAYQRDLERSGFYASRSGSITQARWVDRGPSNVAGRTRAILVDKNDPRGLTVYAGSATGGLWRTCDISADVTQWEQLSSIWPSMAIGAIAQDPNEPQYIYVGTGDNVDVIGFGVYRSANGGATFELLPSTTNGQWQTVQEMQVHPITGHVYLGTDLGVFRSTDKGETWQKVHSSYVHDLEITSQGIIYVGTNATLLRSPTGNPGSFVNLNNKPGFPSGFSRVEFNICKSQPNIIYLTGASGQDALGIWYSNDGGDKWIKRITPLRNDGTSFATPQAWYDLDIMVKDDNPLVVYAGGIDLFKSNDGGFSWSRISNWAGGAPQYVHADQHYMKFWESDPNIAFFGNDGGVYRTEVSGVTGVPKIVPRIENLNSTTFYAVGMDPGFMSGKFIAGSQDNGTNIVTGAGVGRANEVIGGDGFFCFIDQNEPQYVIGSLYFGDWFLSNDGGATMSAGGAGTNSNFRAPADYDNELNVLYGQTNNSDYFYWPINSTPVFVNVPGFNFGNTTAFLADPNQPGRLYVGTSDGRLFLLTNANSPEPTAQLIGSFTGTISGIDVEVGNPNRVLVSLSNYGLTHNIFLTTNGGVDWVGCEGSTLPNMPVRDCMFNPLNTNQAFIATEAGVWVTEQLAGSQTVWYPPAPGRGLPLVRTDMLQYRSSDRVIAAATYGAGIWTTGVLSDPYAVAHFQKVGYVGSQITFDASRSIGDQNVIWTISDGSTSDQVYFQRTFNQAGLFNVSLSVNGFSTTQDEIHIIGNASLPQTPGTTDYFGDFESGTQVIGVSHDNPSGSKWEFGNSTLPYKNGVRSGAKAIVLGANDAFYKNNTETAFYLPKLNMTEPGIYELSFWGKWQIGPSDGMVVEYSLDNGTTWKTLGSSTSQWYNRSNIGFNQSPWPTGQPFFGGEVVGWTNFKTPLTFLTGNASVAIRFVFKSGALGIYRGIVIDDVVISRYDNFLKTRIADFQGKVEPNKVRLNWTTMPEYYAQRFIVQASDDGVNWRNANNGVIVAKGGISNTENTYEYEFNEFKQVYFLRLLAISSNQNSPTVVATDKCGYPLGELPTTFTDTVVTKVLVLRRNADDTRGVYKLYPNPFTDRITLVFNDVIEDVVTFKLFDVAGRLLLDETAAPQGISYTVPIQGLPSGQYFLQVAIGADKPVSYPVLTVQ